MRGRSSQPSPRSAWTRATGWPGSRTCTAVHHGFEPSLKRQEMGPSPTQAASRPPGTWNVAGAPHPLLVRFLLVTASWGGDINDDSQRLVALSLVDGTFTDRSAAFTDAGARAGWSIDTAPVDQGGALISWSDSCDGFDPGFTPSIPDVLDARSRAIGPGPAWGTPASADFEATLEGTLSDAGIPWEGTILTDDDGYVVRLGTGEDEVSAWDAMPALAYDRTQPFRGWGYGRGGRCARLPRSRRGPRQPEPERGQRHRRQQGRGSALPSTTPAVSIAQSRCSPRPARWVPRGLAGTCARPGTGRGELGDTREPGGPVRLLLLLSLVACENRVRPPGPPEPPPADPVVQAEMGAHFAEIDAVREALVRGDVAATRAGFEALAATTAPAGLPEGSAPLFEAMRGAAKQGAGAGAAADQATALADTLRACGGCHAKVHARPEWQVPPAPGRDPGVRLHMARHAWAVDRMVEGLVGPTESSWSQAAAILNDEPVTPGELAKGATLTPEAQAAGERLHALGKEALEATTPEDRGARFAEVLTTCATCHGAVGMGPTPE